MKLTKTDLESLIVEGSRCARAVVALERKKNRLDEIKAIFRELAGAENLKLTAPGGATVTVDQKADTTARVVATELLTKVQRLAGEAFFSLFTVHPSKGDAKNFELNAHNNLPKAKALELIKTLRVKATAWVSFS